MKVGTHLWSEKIWFEILEISFLYIYYILYTYIIYIIYIYIYISIYISVHKVWGTRVASWDVSRATAFIFVTLRAK